MSFSVAAARVCVCMCVRASVVVVYCTRTNTMAVYTLTILPDARTVRESSRRVARVHTASTASGSSGTLRPHQEVLDTKIR